jgi:hypothetical protein
VRRRAGTKAGADTTGTKDGPEKGSGPTDASSVASAAAGQPVSSDPSDADGDALPVWLAPAGIALLFAAAGTTALLRRRRGATGA